MSLRVGATGNTAATTVALLALAIGGNACREKPVGQLVLSLHTDMSIPEQIDVIRVQVLTHGMRQLDVDYPVGRSDQEDRIPATLTLLAGKDASQPVTIRVSGGKRNGVWRTFREVITTVPVDRQASLRMPIQWLCDGTAKMTADPEAAGSGRQLVSSTCGDGNSCVAGQCVPSPVPEALLPDFKPQQIFGGTSDPATGSCFDTVACMAGGVVVEPSDEDCSVPAPASLGQGGGVNVALRVPGNGICDQTSGTCFVPLDADSPEGWSFVGGGDRLALPRAVCDKLKRGAISGVYVSTGCPSKTAAIPPCGAWSSVHGATMVPMVMAGQPPPSATKVLSVATSGTRAGVPCCPLMSDGDLFFTCVCTDPTRAQVVSIDVVTQEVKPLIAFGTPADRKSPYFAAAVSDRTLFWVDAVADIIHRESLSDGGVTTMSSLTVKGDITEAAPLLVDGSAIYLLAGAVAGASGSAVQLLAIDRRSTEMRAFDTGANFHVHEMAQDPASVYLVSDLDTRDETQAPLLRRSRVVAIAKSDGTRTDVSETSTVTTADPLHGGYIGVHADSGGRGGIYSIHEDAPSADGGSLVTRIVRLDPATRTGTKLLERTLSLPSSTLWLLGVVDGGVLLVRSENEPAPAGDAPAIRASSVVVLPAGGGAPYIAADFVHDHPVLGINALGVDASSVYWLNSSGELYRLPRKALQ